MPGMATLVSLLRKGTIFAGPAIASVAERALLLSRTVHAFQFPFGMQYRQIAQSYAK